MFRKHILGLTLGFALVAGIAPVHAGPIVYVDMDPSSAGIQSAHSVIPGSTFFVDVGIINPSNFINGFQFDLDYDFPALTATSLVSGGYFGLGGFPVFSDLLPPDVNFAEGSIFPTIGNGILATIGFDANGGGTYLLGLNDVLLSEGFGTPVILDDIQSGSVTVAPEPTSIALLGSGMIGLGFWANRKRKLQ